MNVGMHGRLTSNPPSLVLLTASATTFLVESSIFYSRALFRTLLPLFFSLFVNAMPVIGPSTTTPFPRGDARSPSLSCDAQQYVERLTVRRRHASTCTLSNARSSCSWASEAKRTPEGKMRAKRSKSRKLLNHHPSTPCFRVWFESPLPS